MLDDIDISLEKAADLFAEGKLEQVDSLFTTLHDQHLEECIENK